MTELLVFGVDGFSNRVIQMLGEEEMPTIHKLQQQDRTVYGEYKSYVIPNSGWSVPLTGPMWTTIYTGLKPEEHGLMAGGWEQGDSRFHEMYTVWDKISEETDKTMALWGMPMTYKAKEIQGFMMSGFVHPVIKPLQDNLLYPDNLEENLPEDFLEFTSAYMAKTQTEEGFHEDMPETPEEVRQMYHEGEFNRLAAFLATLDQRDENPDIVAYGTTYADKMGHTQAGINPTNETTRKTYRDVDQILDELIDELDPTNVVIISDHGFSGYTHDVFGYYLDTAGNGMHGVFDFAPWLLNHLKQRYVGCEDLEYSQDEYGPVNEGNELSLSEEERDDVMDRLDALGYETDKHSDKGGDQP